MKEKENETCYLNAPRNESKIDLKLFFCVSYRLFVIVLHASFNGATCYFERGYMLVVSINQRIRSYGRLFDEGQDKIRLVRSSTV